MTNETEKSDRLVVPKKHPNKEVSKLSGITTVDLVWGTKAETPETEKGKPTDLGGGGTLAEDVEGRGLAKGNSFQRATRHTQGWVSVSHALARIRLLAQKDKNEQFTTLLHHVYALETLREAYLGLKRNAAAGVDGVTWSEYGRNLESNLEDLSSRLRRGAYRAPPVRRHRIKKADGSDRLLGIATLEDKLVQLVMARVLNAIYEVDFLGFSYGFRRGRSQHNALDALNVGLLETKVNWVLDADIRGFFDTIDHECLMRLLEYRIGDYRVLRLIQKWLKAVVMEDGEWSASERGSPQGASISPLLANIFLHYVFDLWAQEWRKKNSDGEVCMVRYCDDLVVGFKHQEHAECFRRAFEKRLRDFGLELHPVKTRLLEFGFRGAFRQKACGGRRLGTFDFLGFTHYCGWTRKGGFRVKRKTARKRVIAKLKALREETMRRRHLPIPDQGKWLSSVVVGHCQYYGVPFNSQAIQRFRFKVVRLWQSALSRRSQKGYVPWKRMQRLAKRWIPRARIVHDYPEQRFNRSTRGRRIDDASTHYDRPARHPHRNGRPFESRRRWRWRHLSRSGGGRRFRDRVRSRAFRYERDLRAHQNSASLHDALGDRYTGETPRLTGRRSTRF